MAPTIEEFKASVLAGTREEWNHHACGACGSPVKYARQGEGIFFDSNCDCTYYWSEPQPKSWQDLYDFLSSQNRLNEV